jgi:hypothetical protein
MQHVGDVAFGRAPWTANGPDISFLSLPHDVVGILEATGCVFLNLEGRGDALRQAGSLRGFHCIAGVVAESTRMTGSLSRTGRADLDIQFSVEPGDAVKRMVKTEFDYFDFVPQKEEGYDPPTSYAGMSGGGLWFGFTDTGGTDSPGPPLFIGATIMHGIEEDRSGCRGVRVPEVPQSRV